ncbi:hypothetical protein [Paenibacillus sp. FSL H7-0331]|uniref:hypothetical protein n=1 Tax=Paenibacillus sp. FSL H7-0331 TaxID=1920421 RepID=UPI00096C19FD|nr:hypothetical protein [Paenibacillus sp. FSL H7-0331]OME97908.1 hypothetical protein BK127_40020 [Paenibacillus sp. FSL H7-0331]
MIVQKTEKEKHLQMVYKNNVVIARKGNKIIVVHSKRSIKPLLPFEISNEVLDQWKRRDTRIAETATPYNELFPLSVNQDKELFLVTDFNEIEFIED